MCDRRSVHRIASKNIVIAEDKGHFIKALISSLAIEFTFTHVAMDKPSRQSTRDAAGKV
jgi:hypothetical protein